MPARQRQDARRACLTEREPTRQQAMQADRGCLAGALLRDDASAAQPSSTSTPRSAPSAKPTAQLRAARKHDALLSGSAGPRPCLQAERTPTTSAALTQNRPAGCCAALLLPLTGASAQAAGPPAALLPGARPGRLPSADGMRRGAAPRLQPPAAVPAPRNPLHRRALHRRTRQLGIAASSAARLPAGAVGAWQGQWRQAKLPLQAEERAAGCLALLLAVT